MLLLEVLLEDIVLLLGEAGLDVGHAIGMRFRRDSRRLCRRSGLLGLGVRPLGSSIAAVGKGLHGWCADGGFAVL